MSQDLITGQDGKARCWWCGDDPLYVSYHDGEWGVPTRDDISLYEKVCLEGFQAGLSWITVLRKRENFRSAFAGFDFEKVARFDDKDVERLVQDAGIIRHRGKIEAAINNAQRTCDLVDERGSLERYFWDFAPNHARVPPETMAGMVSETKESHALSKDLKKKGFKFVGPTTMYAHMQAMGLVNDHLQGCFRRSEVETLRQTIKLT